MSNLGGTLRNQDWSSMKLTPFEKNFYVEDKAVTHRSDREIEEFRREKEIRVCKARVDLALNILLMFSLGFVGTRTRRSATRPFVRGGWFPGIYHDVYSCCRLQGALADSGSVVAHGSFWSRRREERRYYLSKY